MMDATQQDKNREQLLGHTSPKPDIQITVPTVIPVKRLDSHIVIFHRVNPRT